MTAPAHPSRRQCDARPRATATLGATIAGSVRALWAGLRAVTGDDAYERYIEHHAAQHPGTPPLSRRAFYEAEQNRQWSRINRCC